MLLIMLYVPDHVVVEDVGVVDDEVAEMGHGERMAPVVVGWVPKITKT